MGKMKEDPRYNVLSFRASDLEYIQILLAAGDKPVAEFLAAAVREKLINDRQTRFYAELQTALSAR